MSTQPPAPVRKAATLLYVAAALAVVAAAVTVADQAVGDALAHQLQRTYPQRAADRIGAAESSIPTYLFTLAAAGAALFAWLGRASRRGRRGVRGTGTVAVALGTALAAYNFSQPHPLLITVAGLLPCLGGAAAMALLWGRESSAHFKSLSTRPTA
ncbi:hypothetical protein AB0I22_29605 [Streptomyces sp. NPDC050610]|uniref:hypothetical protein n=1 Tax=Streptomyces sp. NPDC050610 TaxID=3157097 RepID=UPI00341B6F7D